MYKNKKNVMDFIENVKNIFARPEYIIKFNTPLLMYNLSLCTRYHFFTNKNIKESVNTKAGT